MKRLQIKKELPGGHVEARPVVLEAMSVYFIR